MSRGVSTYVCFNFLSNVGYQKSGKAVSCAVLVRGTKHRRHSVRCSTPKPCEDYHQVSSPLILDFFGGCIDDHRCVSLMPLQICFGSPNPISISPTFGKSSPTDEPEDSKKNPFKNRAASVGSHRDGLGLLDSSPS